MNEETTTKIGIIFVLIVFLTVAFTQVKAWANNSCKQKAVDASIKVYTLKEFPDAERLALARNDYRKKYIDEHCK